MSPRQTHRPRLEVEQLEERRLLAAPISLAPPVLPVRSSAIHQAPAAKVATLSDDARQIVAYTNDYRRSQGRPLLRINRLLVLAAQRHADRLVRSKTLGDRGPNGLYDPHILHGQTVWNRVVAAGYPVKAVGENIMPNYGFVLTPEEEAALLMEPPIDFARQAIDGWIASTGHRSNLLDRRFTEIGVGIATRVSGESKLTIAVQVFGRR